MWAHCVGKKKCAITLVLPAGGILLGLLSAGGALYALPLPAPLCQVLLPHLSSPYHPYVLNVHFLERQNNTQ